ncbi:MAG TPA: hypothetical protein PLH27_08255 [bacterium]|nr:hypothetical protein [bacterium]HMZ04128.1 hypothetical protein [bacterium]HNB10856.1 hypothetical protein [bacterium]HNC48962.1 hypothetical protein [bacterium]HNE85510.1 hypothetical protein [bacterium]
MNIQYDEIEISKPFVNEPGLDDDRTLILQTNNARRWLHKLIDEMTLEQRFLLLDYAQSLITHQPHEETSSTLDSKINVLRAIEEAAKKRNEEPLANLISDIMRPH